MQIGINVSGYSTQDKWTETYMSDLSAGRNVIMEAGNDLNLKGGTQVNAGQDITLVAGHDINLEAAKDTHSHSGENWGANVGFDLQGAGISIGGNYGYDKGNGEVYTNATVNAGGNLVTVSGNDTSIIGGNLHGDTVDMTVGGNLTLETLQDENHYESKSGGASITIGPSGPTGGSINYAQADADSKWSNSISSITSDGKLELNVGNNTTLIGSVINNANGDLTLNTDTLTAIDLKESDKSSSISIGISTSPGSGIAGGIGFGFSNEQTEGITRATVGEGTIDTHSDIGGLNRDINKMREITYESSTGMHMTVPAVDSGRIVEEGRVVVPTAYAIYETGINVMEGVMMTPEMLVERFLLDGVYKGKNAEHLFEYPHSTFQASIDDYNVHYLIGMYAYENHPEYLPALFGDKLPLIGNFLPGPTGPLGEEATQLWYFPGIAEKNADNENSRDMATRKYYLDNGLEVNMNTYDHGSAIEVLFAGLFGYNARGVQALGQMLNENKLNDSFGNTINGMIFNTAGHSGGGMRELQMSRYAGYLGASVGDMSAVQTPVIGFYQNVQNIHLYESFAPSKQEVTSMMGTGLSFLLFTNQGPVVLGDVVVQWEGDGSIHLQTGNKEYDKKETLLQTGNAFDEQVLKNLRNNLKKQNK
jgi:hypothetical protein